MPVYIVTGANRGIGLEYVRQISSASTNTVIAAVRSLSGELDDLNSLASNTSNGSKIHILECDTSSVSSIHSFAQKAIPIFNEAGGNIDVLINNAGINAVPDQTSLTLNGDDLQQHVSINVTGPAELVKQMANYLGKGSVIVNMTSGLGSCGKALTKCTAYAISKAALNMLSVHQAGHLGEKGVRVMCIDPGWVKTRMGGSGAALEAEESVKGMLGIVGRARKGTDGGEVGTAKFYLYDGSEIPW